MRVVLRVIFYIVAITALWWLLPRISANLNEATEAASTAAASRGYALFAIYLLVGAGVALLVAWDVSRALGTFAGSLFVGGGRLPSITPVLWKADRLCAKGQSLEAITILRDYLNGHPRQWYVGVRIAELYQQAQNDPLSAALEYQQLLGRRLPNPARAELMLRLAACELLLRKPEQSSATLQDLIEKFPKSPMAEKARRRLARMT